MDARAQAPSAKKRTHEMMESQLLGRLSSKADWFKYLEQHL